MESDRKTMSISIDRATHALIKEYCSKHTLKISGWIENLVLHEIYSDQIEKSNNKLNK